MPPCRFVRPDPTHADADMYMYIHTHAHVHIYVHTYTPLRCARRLGSSSIMPALPGHEPLEVRESVVRHRVSDDGTAAASTHTCARNKKTPGSSFSNESTYPEPSPRPQRPAILVLLPHLNLHLFLLPPGFILLVLFLLPLLLLQLLTLPFSLLPPPSSSLLPSPEGRVGPPYD
eukprot:GHVU01010521.1.p1 GENE.GHVU01010521.1~~GHVU01010521.1.p1  ORF type:complete len:174 (-),score=13.38 GHVU01010521.1:156-677(-)